MTKGNYPVYDGTFRPEEPPLEDWEKDMWQALSPMFQEAAEDPKTYNWIRNELKSFYRSLMPQHGLRWRIHMMINLALCLLFMWIGKTCRVKSN